MSGDPLLLLAPPRRRRAGGRGALLVVLAVGVLAVVLLAGREASEAEPPRAVAPAPPAPDDRGRADAAAAGDRLVVVGGVVGDAVGGADRTASAPAQQPLGTAAGLSLRVPAADPVVVSYHEASHAEAQPIAPSGTPGRNDNVTRSFDALGGPGPEYQVQVSRGRLPGPTTAVDVVLPSDQQVLAPVAGVITEVRRYRLYGAHDDVRIELRPDDAPDLRVVLIHVDGVAVAQGDRVVLGDVLADRARLFPFEAVVDRATAPERFGHVHLEVKPPGEDTVVDQAAG